MLIVRHHENVRLRQHDVSHSRGALINSTDGAGREGQETCTGGLDWRVGVRNRLRAEAQYRYGIVLGVSCEGGGEILQIRFDGSQSVENVDATQHDMDWVQPDLDLSLARKRMWIPAQLSEPFQSASIDKAEIWHWLCMFKYCN